jgi:hypothetical protein
MCQGGARLPDHASQLPHQAASLLSPLRRYCRTGYGTFLSGSVLFNMKKLYNVGDLNIDSTVPDA